MKTKVTEEGVLIPKRFLKGIKEVEIRKENDLILVVPIVDDPILQLGSEPVEDEIEPVTLQKPRPQFGSAEGLLSVSDDFDEPVEDFEEYMR
jgi:hypothetical protein